MLDIQQLRNNLDGVVNQLESRGFILEPAKFMALDLNYRAPLRFKEELNAKRNAKSKQIGILKSKGEDASEMMLEVLRINEDIKQSEIELVDATENLNSFLLNLPNLAHESVPPGNDETANKEVRRWDAVRKNYIDSDIFPQKLNFPVIPIGEFNT